MLARERLPFEEIFADRRAAGRALARTLSQRGDQFSVVIGLTRGGVPVASEVAASLKLPLDVLVVKKLRAPVSAELAIGAICADATQVSRAEVIRELGVSDAYMTREVESRLAEAQEAERRYRGGLPPVDLAGASVAVVGDGMATGATMEAAVRIHWGPNMRERPTPAFQWFARRVIDAGADIFWGHSAHLVQGVEMWHGRPIFYDTGDLVDDYAVGPVLRNDLSALFLVRIEARGVDRVDLVPIRIADMQVNPSNGSDRDWFVARFTHLCEEMGTVVSDYGDRLTVRLVD